MRQKVEGFTLPELLFAAAVLAFVLVSLLFIFTSCLFLDESSRNSTLATSHAEYVIEDIKDTSFAQIPAMAGTWDTSAITAAGLNPVTGESIVIAVSGVNPLNINVTVNWSDRGNRSRSISFSTLITEP
ncbi:MAG: hypothetical protein ISS27_01000 [Candidatus Omnitrophica bacterium]|nr:hypothetical protein [Candidatus Omnitrophota bacterium]